MHFNSYFGCRRIMLKQIKSNIYHMDASVLIGYPSGQDGPGLINFNLIQPDPTSRVQLQVVQSRDGPSATT